MLVLSRLGLLFLRGRFAEQHRSGRLADHPEAGAVERARSGRCSDWDPRGQRQLGYVPTPLNKSLLAAASSQERLVMAMGGLIIGEFRRGSESGVRVGLRVLIGPAGEILLERLRGRRWGWRRRPRFLNRQQRQRRRLSPRRSRPRVRRAAPQVRLALGPAASAARVASKMSGTSRADAARKLSGCMVSAGAGNIVFRCGNCKAKKVSKADATLDQR